MCGPKFMHDVNVVVWGSQILYTVYVFEHMHAWPAWQVCNRTGPSRFIKDFRLPRRKSRAIVWQAKPSLLTRSRNQGRSTANPLCLRQSSKPRLKSLVLIPSGTRTNVTPNFATSRFLDSSSKKTISSYSIPVFS